jgi:hypothetical protein
MKTMHKVILAGAATLFLAVPAAAAVPGMGWDVFNIGEGEPIPSGSSYVGTAMDSAPGQGFDLFNSGDGVKIEGYEQAYLGTSLGSKASGSWDVFRIGEGDPLP